jgi:hypothetical protein
MRLTCKKLPSKKVADYEILSYEEVLPITAIVPFWYTNSQCTKNNGRTIAGLA